MGNTEKQTNNQLTTAFKNNDQKVMQMVYINTFPKFRSHTLKNSGNEAQAKDVFQEAFIACWRNIKEDKLTINSNVEGYLLTIAKNKWIDFLRSSDYKKTTLTEDFSHLKVITEDPNIETEKVAETQRIRLQKAIRQLGQNCKELLRLFYFERKSMQEISQKMNLVPASARNQKYRCMEKLRTLSLQLKNNG